MILPPYITATRSQVCTTTEMSWVMKRSAMPRSRRSRASRDRICACVTTSSAVVGSSAIRSCGSSAIAMAITARCFMPPDISCG
jgi:hypothetical protein